METNRAYILFAIKVLIITAIWRASSAMAFTYYGCPAGTGNPPVAWDPWELPVPISAHATSFASGTSTTQTLENAILVFNRNPSNVTYSVSFGDSSVAVTNGQNEIWWTTGATGDTALGRTYTHRSCTLGLFGYSWDMKETDIVMYDQHNWVAQIAPHITYAYDLYEYGGTNNAMVNTMVHELLHGVGLMHEGDEYNIMGSSQNFHNVNAFGSQLHVGEDAARGLVYIYGARSDILEDVGVSERKYDGYFTSPGQGSYATASLVGVYDSSMNLKPTDINSDNQIAYKVSSGEMIYFEFTLENIGKNTQDVTLDFYLSSNSLIQPPEDYYLGSANETLTIDSADTITFSATLPGGLSTGVEYWLGTRITMDNDFDNNPRNQNTRIPLIID